MMKKLNLMKLSCAIALSSVPFYTHATSGQIGLKACADALVGELSSSNGTSVAYQLNSANVGFERKLLARETFNLYARDPHSNQLVSRMDCVVNGKGQVVKLTSMPLDAEENGDRVTRAD